jgi:hypothetical protein
MIFISKHYVKKIWTDHERKNAQARAVVSQNEYILPVRFDHTPLPGLVETIGYINVAKLAPSELADSLYDKLLPERLMYFQSLNSYFPPRPDILYEEIGASSRVQKLIVDAFGRGFFEALGLMSARERRIVATCFIQGCPHDLPDNVHISQDLLRRATGIPVNVIRTLLIGMGSVGFEVRLPKPNRKSGSDLIYLRWKHWTPQLRSLLPTGDPNFTGYASKLIGVLCKNYCAMHAAEAICRLNFSALSSATAVLDRHVETAKLMQGTV